MSWWFRSMALSCALMAVERQAVGWQEVRRPNILLIITDDQGYGDLGFHGNPRIKTPTLDRLAAQSVAMTRFYVSPVCSPTRASLLTGRYNYRTGVVDTFWGRSMMFTDEVTLAETLAGAGYATAIFGKWHLGDCAPMRAMDQGFADSLVHLGGGLRQPSDPPGSTGYFNPTLFRNGRAVQTRGFCSNVYVDAAIDFIDRHRKSPFFVYLPFNCPHLPLEIEERKVEPYRKPVMRIEDFPADGQPIGANFDPEDTAKIYATVEDIDGNIGRLLATLDRLSLSENTVVIFLTDNGPQKPRYNGGLRGLKGTVYEGGIRVPFFVRWPARFAGGRKIDEPAAHIDVVPTLLAACGVSGPIANSKRMDGVDLLPLWEGRTDRLRERTLFFQWHRGNVPEVGRAFAALSRQWKLVQARGTNGMPFEAKHELFDVTADPFETTDRSAEQPQIADRLLNEYRAWMAEMKRERDFRFPKVRVGREYEPFPEPVMLTQQDWRSPDDQPTSAPFGKWTIEARPGTYEFIVRFRANRGVERDRRLRWSINETHREMQIEPTPFRMNDAVVAFDYRLPDISLDGLAEIAATAEVDGKRIGADFVFLRQRGDGSFANPK